MKYKSLNLLLRTKEPSFSNDNLHRIAISNLENPTRRIERWWSKKYGPLKQFEDHTHEELLVEMLEDYYEANPEEVEKFIATEGSRTDTWDGSMSHEYEREIQKRLKKINERNRVDISKYQSDEALSAEEEKAILDNLGRNLPGSKVVTKRDEVLGREFDEEF
jgi:hypothetical protein